MVSEQHAVLCEGLSIAVSRLFETDSVWACSLLHLLCGIYEMTSSNRLRPPSPPLHHGRGIRDRVRGFSRESRTNLLRRLASINRGAFKAFKGRMIFVTLTYPHEYPEDPELCKNHLKALRRRLQRTFGDFAGFWRLGIQQRGAWHFHLLLFVGPSIAPIGKLRR